MEQTSFLPAYQRTCTHPGCDAPYHAQGYCEMHYFRKRKGQDMDPPKRGTVTWLCSEDGCLSKVYAKGLCNMHYLRLKRGSNMSKPRSRRKNDPIKPVLTHPVQEKPAKTNGAHRSYNNKIKPLLWGDKLAKAIVKQISEFVVPTGDLMGQPFKVLDWEEEFIYGMANHLISYLTIGRGNGKTGLIAAIADLTLVPDGALYLPRRRTIITASSLDQAKECFDMSLIMIEPRIEEERAAAKKKREKNPWRVIDNSHEGRIQHVSRSEVRVMGSDPRRAHGKGPGLLIGDEPAQWPGADKGRKQFNVMKTSRGKQTDCRLLILGTRPENYDHWWARELDSPPKNAFVMDFSCDKDDEDFAMESIRKANPSWDHLPELRRVVLEEMEDAELGGDDLLLFRAHRLNKGTPETMKYEKLMPIENWEAVVTMNAKPRKGIVFIGYDLGGWESMSAAAFYWPETGRLEVKGAFPAMPSLIERGKKDAVGNRYAKMYERGEIVTYPGWATNNVQFLKDATKSVENFEIKCIGADNYKQTDLKQAMFESGLDAQFELMLRRVGRGVDGGEDVRAFQNEVAEGYLSCEPCLALDSAIAEAVIHRDSNGNAALHKARAKGRIDVLQAAIIAVGMGRRWRKPSGDDRFKFDFDSGEELVMAV